MKIHHNLKRLLLGAVRPIVVGLGIGGIWLLKEGLEHLTGRQKATYLTSVKLELALWDR